jgi:hypothetical protein
MRKKKPTNAAAKQEPVPADCGRAPKRPPVKELVKAKVKELELGDPTPQRRLELLCDVVVAIGKELTK